MGNYLMVVIIMCGRFFIDYEFKAMVQHYHLSKYNGAFVTGEIYPSNKILCVVNDLGVQMQWGYDFDWAKNLIINAKSETIFDKKMFQQSIKNKRCIIPASSYFEWQQNNGQKDKIEIFKPQRKFMSLAGIYQSFEDDLGNTVQKFVILTKDPLDAIKNVHDRMPVILDESDEQQWLDYNIQDIEKIKAMIYNFNERLDQKISV